VQAESEVGAADDVRIVVRLEPSGAQVHPSRRESCKPALELDAPGTVAGDENRQIRESAARTGCLPAADAIFEAKHRVDHHIGVLVLRPARRT
jgi:hypothetical protein